MFPARSWEQKPGSTQSTDYARQLMALMDSMVAAAEQGLSVEPILQVAHLGTAGRGCKGGAGIERGGMICRREGPGVEMTGLGLKGRGLESRDGGVQRFVCGTSPANDSSWPCRT